MKVEEMVDSMNFVTNNKSSEFICEVCAKCKIHVQPFKNSVHREREILSLIHSDICGPMSVESLGGAKYFVTFSDDCTGYTETIMLRNRSDVLEAFKDYKRKVEKQTGQQIRRLRTDNGREYLSNSFKNFLKAEGIVHQLSVEYTPQQNGVAKRKNRTLVEMARCIMLQGNLPQSLWAEAINTATYLRNRCATKTLNGKTPYEAWTNRKPYVGFLRVIGTKAIVLNKSQKRGKFQPKGDEYIHGYSQESKAYRLWKPGTKTVVKARHVKFFERRNLSNIPEKNVFDALEDKVDDTSILQPPDTPNEDFSSEESEAEIDDQDDIQEATDEDTKKSHRGRGRPKSLRTGRPGRPKKIYQTKNTINQDPQTVSEALDRNDREA